MNEVEFGYRVRQALSEGASKIDYKTAYRLQKARQRALQQLHDAAPAPVWLPALQTAGARSGSYGSSGEPGLWSWLKGLGLLAPLLVLVGGFVGIYQWQKFQRISELADIDFAVLLDEAPIAAYADSGFSLFLQNEGDEE
jgi:Protein of unknown function (DUF3619)